MSPHRSRILAALSLLLLSPGIVLQAGEATGADASVDVVHYRLPEKWTSYEGGAGRRVLVAPGGDEKNQAAILLTVTDLPAGRPVDLRAEREKFLKVALVRFNIVQQSEILASKTGTGYEVLSQNLAVDDDEGNRIFVSVSLVSLKAKLATFCFTASPREQFDKHYPTLLTFLEQLSFEGAGDVVAGEGPTPEQREIARRKADLQRQLAELEAQEKKAAQSAGPATPPSGTASPHPAPSPDRAAENPAKALDDPAGAPSPKR